MSHTPGPWRVGVSGDAVYQTAVPELRVALCRDVGQTKKQRATEAANARLIAAAPDLLAALKDLSTRVERQIADGGWLWLPDHACLECVPHGDGHFPDFQCARHAALSLIAKVGK